MEDLIKRKDAIKAEADRVYKVLHLAGCKESYEDCLKDAAKTFKDIPSAEKQGEWIPCSERLPEEGESVLVTSKYGHVYTSLFAFGDWEYGGKVIAWMPLPESWKGADDE